MEMTEDLLTKTTECSLLDTIYEYEGRGFSMLAPGNMSRGNRDTDAENPQLRLSNKVTFHLPRGKLLYKVYKSPEERRLDSFATLYYFRNRLKLFIVNLSIGRKDNINLYAQESKFLKYFPSTKDSTGDNGIICNIHSEETNKKHNTKLLKEMSSQDGLLYSSSTLDNSSEGNLQNYYEDEDFTAKSSQNKANNKTTSTTVSLKKKGGLKKKFDSVFEKCCIKIEHILKGKDKRTTVMIRNIPNKYTLSWLINEINREFQNKYDFIYLPLDYDNHCNLGFAFVNFIDPLHIIHFYYLFQGKVWDMSNSEKICSLAYGKIQGLEKLVSSFGKGNVTKDQNSLLISPASKNSGRMSNIVIPLKYKKILVDIYPWAHYGIYKNRIIVYDLF